MSNVRVLVGTRKGGFILTSDGKRETWQVSGPHFAGWEIYHMKGSLVDPNRIYASQTSGWFGQILQASNDGGKTWFQPGVKPEDAKPQWPPVKSNRFAYDSSAETGKPLTTHQWYDGTQHPWEFKRVWHLEPSHTDSDTVYAGVEDAALFSSTDGGVSWHELQLQVFRSRTGGNEWEPLTKGLPQENCYVNVLRDAMAVDTLDDCGIYFGTTGGQVYCSSNGGDSWQPIVHDLPAVLSVEVQTLH
jgi:photosystem II stability/assembly factor-like uncharacterized protein